MVIKSLKEKYENVLFELQKFFQLKLEKFILFGD